ncbi:hypothetical protein MKD49_05555 [Herbaspirillum sp. WGmk3]|uniref:hypothetical protein n=1 Tax=Herbaspirillum sp. WGmk3 TaxID=2919925 RepID=UPI0020904F12|nr:hypothetical protein [Herbaspirillum sp. WGmk3]MCO4855948.1 hypothetical protein [Herbaspirillum sp. WGmk3]
MNNEKLEKIKKILDIVVLISGFGAAFGGILVFLYCFTEGFVLRNLSLSDTFILFYALFVFTTIFIIGFFYGTFCIVWFARGMQLLARKFGKTPQTFVSPELGSWGLAITSLFGFTLFVILPILGEPLKMEEYLHIVAFFCINGLFFTVLFLSTHSTNQMERSKRIIVQSTILVSTIFIFKPALLSMSFTAVGLRSNAGDVLIMDEATQKELAGYFNDLGRRWKACPEITGRHWITKDVRAVWHGIGDVSYVRLYGAPENGTTRRSEPLVSIGSSGIKLMRETKDPSICSPA